MSVGATVDGKAVPLFDWQADVEADWGDRSLTGKLPRSVTWAEQGAPIVIWRGPDDALWSGELTTDPRDDGDVLHIRAHGGAEKIAALSSAAGNLPFYRIDGAERFEPSESDPFNDAASELIDADARGGRLIFIGTQDELYAVSARAGMTLWVEGGLITRVRYVFKKTTIHTNNFDIRTNRFTGPNGAQTTVDDLPPQSTADGTDHAFNITTPEDAIVILLRCNTGFTPTSRHKYWLKDLRVYGRTTNDAFSASEVVADVGGMAGLQTDGVGSNSLAVLPLLWEEDHTALLDYMAELCDWRWLVRHDGLHFGPYERIWESATDHGAAPSLEPQERSNVFVQPYRSLGGQLRRATATADPDPFPGQSFVTYGEEFADPQPDGTLATAVATAAVAYESAVRMAGSVELTEVRYRGAARDPVDVNAGDLLQLTDLAPVLGPQRIEAVTYRQQAIGDRVAVSVQIGEEFNLVRTLRDADRPQRRIRAKSKKRRKKKGRKAA